MDTHSSSSSSSFLILARTLVMCNLFGVYLYECLEIEAAKIKSASSWIRTVNVKLQCFGPFG